MPVIDKYTVSETFSVKESIEKMQRENIKAVVVIDQNKHVCGLFTNGDMRSFFLKGGNLSSNIRQAMNKAPKLYHSMEEIIKERMDVHRVIYPIVNDERKLVNVFDYNLVDNNGSVVSDSLKNVPLVIMAGGKGTRLYPYTNILPKPLIPIGDKTITERIIDNFARFGCQSVLMILNYKSNMIKAYMNEIDKKFSIDFVDEKVFCGTGGGLKLLSGKISSTFFLSNCDILVDADLECVYKTHKQNENKITFVCAMKDFVIPYGVITTNDDGTIKEMSEKPDFSYLINTGLYVIEPEIIDEIGQDEFIHLPDLAKRLIDKGVKVGVFPVSDESWMDMGQFSEMEKMKEKLGL